LAAFVNFCIGKASEQLGLTLLAAFVDFGRLLEKEKRKIKA
jgi:hypothetical protein